MSTHGTVILVARDPYKLRLVQEVIERRGGQAVSIVCDMSDMTSVQHAAATLPSARVQDPDFTARVVAETRSLQEERLQRASSPLRRKRNERKTRVSVTG